MSWYRHNYSEANGDGRALYRLPLTFENTSGGSGNATFSLLGIADLDEFWTNVQSDGYDIIITTAEGRTIIAPTAWDISGFNKTNRAGTIRIQALTMPAGMSLYWLYWGKNGTAATSQWVGSPSVASPKTVHLHRGDPLAVEASRRILGGIGSAQPRATTPRHALRKEADAALRIYWLLDNLKRTKLANAAGATEWDQPSVGTHEVVDVNDGDVGTMYTVTDGRFAVDGDGRVYYSMIVKAGTTGTSYTARATVTTADGEIQIYNASVIVKTALTPAS